MFHLEKDIDHKLQIELVHSTQAANKNTILLENMKYKVNLNLSEINSFHNLERTITGKYKEYQFFMSNITRQR